MLCSAWNCTANTHNYFTMQHEQESHSPKQVCIVRSLNWKRLCTQTLMVSWLVHTTFKDNLHPTKSSATIISTAINSKPTQLPHKLVVIWFWRSAHFALTPSADVPNLVPVTLPEDHVIVGFKTPITRRSALQSPSMSTGGALMKATLYTHFPQRAKGRARCLDHPMYTNATPT